FFTEGGLPGWANFRVLRNYAVFGGIHEDLGVESIHAAEPGVFEAVVGRETDAGFAEDASGFFAAKELGELDCRSHILAAAPDHVAEAVNDCSAHLALRQRGNTNIESTLNQVVVCLGAERTARQYGHYA